MTKCHICERESFTRCSVCSKDVCIVHAEEESGKSLELYTICSKCIHKRKLRRIRLVAISSVIVMAVIIALILIINSLSNV